MTASHGLSPDEITELVRESRAAQGLPPKITDPIVLRRLADLAAAVRPQMKTGRPDRSRGAKLLPP